MLESISELNIWCLSWESSDINIDNNVRSYGFVEIRYLHEVCPEVPHTAQHIRIFRPFYKCSWVAIDQHFPQDFNLRKLISSLGIDSFF